MNSKILIGVIAFISAILVVQHDTSCQITSTQQFNRISLPKTFPNNTINKIIRDQNGLIWMGTNDGLCRLDSPERVKIFKADSKEYPSGLKSNIISAIEVDDDGVLWIGTKLGGLSRYDYRDDIWETFTNEPENIKSISNNDVLSICIDKKNRKWIGTENGLNLYVDSLQSFIRFLPNDNDENSLSTKAVLGISEDNNGWIWITTWAGGINLLIPDEDGKIQNSIFKHIYPSEDPNTHNIWKILQDKENRFWIASHMSGLFLMQLPEAATIDADNLEWSPTFHNYRNNPVSPITITNDFLIDVLQDNLGNIWIGSVHGLCRISKENLPNPAIYNKPTVDKPKLEFSQNFYNPSNQNTIISNYVKDLYQDEQGLMWIGTEDGLSLYNKQSNNFQSKYISYNNYSTIDTKSMTILEEGTILLQINAGELLLYDDQKNELIVNHNFPKITDANIIYNDNEGHIYVLRESGLSKINVDNFKLTNIKIPEWFNKGYHEGIVKSMIKDRKNRIWIGTSMGLYLYDMKQNKFKIFKTDLKDENSISDSAITDILEDNQGNIWIGTFKGLNKLTEPSDSIGFSFTRFLYDDNNSENRIPSNTIIEIEALEDMLYIGSESGFFSYDTKSKKIKNITKNHKKYSIRSIEIYKNKNIWASTSDGIFVYYPENNTFREFKYANNTGQQGFLRRSKASSLDGSIYFGGLTGYTKFHPDKILSNNDLVEVHITNILEMSQDSSKDHNVINSDQISFSHDSYYFSIYYSSNDQSYTEQNKFAYLLEGLNDEWTYTNQNNPIVYTNLNPGKYIFKIKAANNNGVWNENIETIEINIIPAFWQTLWFKFLSFLLLCLIIWLSIILYTKNIRKTNENLNKEITERKKVEIALQEREQYMEELVDERTEELSIQNNKVKSLLSQLEIRNDELEKIVKQRTAKLTQSNQELIKSNKDLEQFAYIASHDLKEPLRTIGTFTSLLHKKYANDLDSKADGYLSFISEGVDRMSNLIQSLLEYSSVGSKDIDLQSTNLQVLIQQVMQDFSVAISEKQMQVTIDPLPTIICDQVQIGMVFSNLIANAVKFNENENPRIHIGVINGSDSHWTFYVKDNGIGIEKEYQNQIFNIFKRLHRKAEYDGTGIGLSLCQKIVLRHNGTIEVESIKNIGSTFKFSISKNIKSSYSKLEIVKTA